MLANAFDKAQSAQTPQQQAWSKTLLSMLHDIHQESAIYLMVEDYVTDVFSVSAAA
ncbi:hypothetical protein LNP74_05380 [Klebsiella pneumoniae subsp. pneumoniae]|nr:hypothetical protein [Klebsiella pneumoniae subsp. pneumoniae]